MFITKSGDNLTSTRRAGVICHSSFVLVILARHLNRTQFSSLQPRWMQQIVASVAENEREIAPSLNDFFYS
jgi:hypothetical protein